MIAEIPALCAQPDLMRQLLVAALIFAGGAMLGVTACIIVNQPKPQPWWMRE